LQHWGNGPAGIVAPRAENEVSAKTSWYSSYVAAKLIQQVSRAGVTRGQFEHFSAQVTAASAWRLGVRQQGLASGTSAMHGKDGLCQIDSDRYDCHSFPSRTS